MSPRRKILRILLGAAGIVAVLLLGLTLLAPRLLDVDAVKTRILTRLEGQTGARLSYGHAEFAFFPRPRLVLREVSLSTPSRAEGTVKRLEAGISPLALLRNRVPIGSLLATAPDFHVRLPEGAKGEEPPSLEEIEEKASRLLSGLASRAPGAVFEIRDGLLTLSAGSRPPVSLRNIQARVSLPPDRLRFRLSCDSSYRSLVLEKATLEGSVQLAEGNFLVSVSRLDMEAPRLRMSGALAVERKSPRIRLEMSGQEAEISRIRSAILSLAGELPEVRSVFDIVKGGSLSRFSARVSGDSAAELGDLRAIEASATLRGGVLSIQDIGLVLTEVEGSATFSNGTLTGTGVRASAGGFRAREGTLRLGLAQPDPPFHAEFLALSDPEGLWPLLRRLIPNRKFQEELDRFKDPKGSVSGRVVLGERLSSIRPIVHATDVRLTTLYDRVPFPLTIDGGKVSYEGDRVEVIGLRGRMGESSFSELTGRLALGETPGVFIRSGKARLSVGELVPWLSSTGFAREALRDVKSARGTVEVSSLTAEGQPGAPGEWKYEASGGLNDLVVELASLPGPVTVRRGGFHLLPQAAFFTGLAAEMLDARASGSADIRYSGAGVSRVDASAEEGGFGPEMKEWASPRLPLPQDFAIRAPLSVSGAGFSWVKDGPISFQGELGHPDGAKMAVSLRKSREGLAIDSIALRDPDSSADLSFHLGPKDLRGKYKGTLHRSTVEKFAAIPAFPFQRLEGSMEISVDLDSPGRSQARGALEGEGIRIPWMPLDPLRIRSFSLSADGTEIRLASADLAWREVPFRMRGKGNLSRDGLEADLDVETGDVPLERLLQHPPGPAAAADPGGVPVSDGGFRFPKLPVRGVFRLLSKSIRYDRWAVQAVAALGELGQDGLNVAVSGAELCGFPIQGRAALDSGGGLALDLRTAASGKDINQPLMCLFDKRVSMTGSFRFDTRLTARGRDKESLIRSVEGPVEFTAREGRIYQMTLLSRILSLLNVTNVVRGKFPDIRQEGIPYESLKIRGEYRAETLLVKEGTLRGPTLGIASTGKVDLRNSKVDMKVLAAPFRTADWIIRKIPLIRGIMKKSLVSVPLDVQGNLYDPGVAFDPVGAGTGLLGILERTIMLPVTIVGDVVEKSERTAPGTR